MKTKLMLFLLFIAAAFSFAAAPPIDHSCSRVPFRPATARTVFAIQVNNLVPQVLQSPSYRPAPAKYRLVNVDENVRGANCPHQRAVDEWYAWRARNPEAHSRYPRGDKHLDAMGIDVSQFHIAHLNFSMAPDDPEPEPDPSWGGCGCDLETALAAGGCGWWMATTGF